MDYKIKDELIKAAAEMRKRAYCPYSHYEVGAALLTSSGKIYTGCNIENASFPATICAERTAAAKAVSDGDREFTAIAIAVSGESAGYPCGVCRQFLNEFAVEGMPVYLVNRNGIVKEEVFETVFPHGFKGKDMD